MKRRRTIPGRDQERGVIILLVALVLLFIVTAFAALAIDVVTFYTARSEAQLAADSIALAGARALANSGMTSDPTNLTIPAENLAKSIALEEASQNQVGGKTLDPGEVAVNFNDGDPAFGTNPHVIVQVTRADLPAFFARIWGRTQITVSASATAEAYNPSGLANVTTSSAPPVAPSCVKPWLLPNIDPINPSQPIFDPNTGEIKGADMLGTAPNTPGPGLQVTCGGGQCNPGQQANPWQYYPGSQTDFPAPAPSEASPSCNAGFNPYQLSIAGCVQQPIVCGQNSSSLTLDTVSGSTMDADTATAINCLTHAQSNQAADSVATAPPGQPFQFLAGTDNPVVGARGQKVVVSSSLVTVPVVNVVAGSTFNAPVKVIGFIQVFLNPGGGPAANGAPAEIVNLVGCGQNRTGQPILGNGASPVAVRLISR